MPVLDLDVGAHLPQSMDQRSLTYDFNFHHHQLDDDFDLLSSLAFTATSCFGRADSAGQSLPFIVLPGSHQKLQPTIRCFNFEDTIDQFRHAREGLLRRDQRERLPLPTVITPTQQSHYAHNLGDYHDESVALHYRLDFDDDELEVIDCIVDYAYHKGMTGRMDIQRCQDRHQD